MEYDQYVAGVDTVLNASTLTANQIAIWTADVDSATPTTALSGGGAGSGFYPAGFLGALDKSQNFCIFVSGDSRNQGQTSSSTTAFKTQNTLGLNGEVSRTFGPYHGILNGGISSEAAVDVIAATYPSYTVRNAMASFCNRWHFGYWYNEVGKVAALQNPATVVAAYQVIVNGLAALITSNAFTENQTIMTAPSTAPATTDFWGSLGNQAVYSHQAAEVALCASIRALGCGNYAYIEGSNNSSISTVQDSGIYQIPAATVKLTSGNCTITTGTPGSVVFDSPVLTPDMTDITVLFETAGAAGGGLIFDLIYVNSTTAHGIISYS